MEPNKVEIVESCKDLPVYSRGMKKGSFTVIKRKRSNLYFFQSGNYKETMNERQYKAVKASVKDNPALPAPKPKKPDAPPDPDPKDPPGPDAPAPDAPAATPGKKGGKGPKK